MLDETSQSGGGPRKFIKWGGDTCPLASYIDTFYFSENSIKIIQNVKEIKMIE